MASEVEKTFQPLLDWLGRHGNAHRFLWLVALASFLVAWNRGLDLLYGILALVLAVLLVSWLLPWLAIRGVTVERRQCEPASAGATVALDYRIHARRPSHHLILREVMPWGENEAQEAINLATVNGEQRLVFSHRCDRRGVFDLAEIDISSGWPFGFVELNRRRETPPCRLVVTPRRFTIGRLPSLRTDVQSIDGYNQTARPDIDNEFAGVREYRFGDSLKHIHWAASARHQHLVVREYESHDRPHLLVVVDGRAGCDIGEAPLSSFEVALSIAASMIDYAVEQQIGLHLVVGCETPLMLTVPLGARNPDDFIEPLAWVRPDGRQPFDQLVASAMERFGAVNAVVTLRNANGSTLLPAIATGHLDILLEDESFRFPARRVQDGWRSRGGDGATLLVSRQSDLEALFAHDQ